MLGLFRESPLIPGALIIGSIDYFAVFIPPEQAHNTRAVAEITQQLHDYIHAEGVELSH